MEFTQYSCPVCGERFKNGDDVVVCPDCGAPHHRECYEKIENCFFADKHREGFNFESSGSGEDSGSDEAAEGVIKCPRCQAENDRTAFYCKTCGFPFNSEDRTNGDGPDRTDQQTNRAQGMPFGFGTAGNPMYDPLAGLKSDDEIADNVKVGEAAKFIGQSTPYYLPMFSRLKQYGSARFNFSAFFLSGAFFIYRKMYVLGIILSLLMIGITVGSTCITMANTWMYDMSYTDLLNGLTSNSLGFEKTAAVFASAGLNLLRVGIMVFSGLFANKLYYRHCTKQINRIKSEHKEGDLNKTLESKGGVNLAMAISFFASYAVIYEICNVYLMMTL